MPTLLADEQVTSTSRLKTVSFFVLRAVLAIAFVGAAIFKLSGQPAAVAEFDQVGLGQGFRYLTAVLEITGSVLLMLPRTIVFGALLLVAICGGAFLAQLLMLHGDVIHTIVLAAIFGAIAWTQRGQLGLKR